MYKNYNRKWTVEKVTEEALKYKTKGEFASNSKSAYNSAKNMGVFDEITNHMVESDHVKNKRIELRYPKDLVQEKVDECYSRTDFWKRYVNYAHAAKKQGFYDELHFPVVIKTGFGYDESKPGRLYYLKCLTTGLYKIGITNKELYGRFGEKMLADEVEVIREWTFQDGSIPKSLETRFHSIFTKQRRLNKRWKENSWSGYTEFFRGNVLKDIIEFDEHFITENLYTKGVK